MPIKLSPRHKQRLSGAGAPGRSRKRKVTSSEALGAPLTAKEKALLKKRGTPKKRKRRGIATGLTKKPSGSSWGGALKNDPKLKAKAKAERYKRRAKARSKGRTTTRKKG